MGSYKTGGKFPGKPLAKCEAKPGMAVDVTFSGAGKGTGTGQPDIGQPSAGGKGSTGTASNSKPR